MPLAVACPGAQGDQHALRWPHVKGPEHQGHWGPLPHADPRRSSAVGTGARPIRGWSFFPGKRQPAAPNKQGLQSTFFKKQRQNEKNLSIWLHKSAS